MKAPQCLEKKIKWSVKKPLVRNLSFDSSLKFDTIGLLRYVLRPSWNLYLFVKWRYKYLSLLHMFVGMMVKELYSRALDP